MNTTLLIDGGLGRQICAIPALEKYVEEHPDTVIVSYFWSQIFWGNKKLSKNIFDSQTKGLFDRLKNTNIIKPEPYFNNNFINQRISLTQAFNEVINDSKDPLEKPKLYFTKSETNAVQQNLDFSKKIVVFQPFGSEARFQNNDVVDPSARSLNLKTTQAILNRLKRENCQVIIYENRDFPCIDEKEFSFMKNLNYRESAALIANCDYFIGIDSSGQHVAHALDKPGTTFFGGTNPVSFGYPDDFSIFAKDGDYEYSYPRLFEFDNWMQNLDNGDVMEYDDTEIEQMCDILVEDIKEKVDE
jgi:ADP-heptose:LPS heptosyltransferase